MSNSSVKPEQRTEIDVLAILQELPEVHLKIFDIAKAAVKPDGTIDGEMLIEKNKEIQEASNEAESYADDTARAVAELRLLTKGTY